VIDCPNCGQQVDAQAPVCTNCGYDIHSQQADSVRQLREEGRIHPGRLTPEQRGEHGEVGPQPHGGHIDALPAEDRAKEGPEQIDAGL